MFTAAGAGRLAEALRGDGHVGEPGGGVGSVMVQLSPPVKRPGISIDVPAVSFSEWERLPLRHLLLPKTISIMSETCLSGPGYLPNWCFSGLHGTGCLCASLFVGFRSWRYTEPKNVNRSVD